MSRISSAPPSAAAPGPVHPETVQLHELAKSIRAVPVAPEILPKLQAKLRDLDTDVADLATLIKLDSGLASGVLKTSNSAYYSRSSSVTSIEEAVSLIGYHETLRMVARCSFGTVMKTSLEHYAIDGEALWTDAVLTAFAMEELCETVAADPSEGYVAGLLHAVGVVAINDFLNRRQHPVAPAAGRHPVEFVEWELATVGFHHGIVGGAMIRQWNMPSALAMAVEQQFEIREGATVTIIHHLLPLAIALARRAGAVVAARKAAAVAAVAAGEDAAAPESADPAPVVPELVFDPERARLAGLRTEQLEEAGEAIVKRWAKTREALA